MLAIDLSIYYEYLVTVEESAPFISFDVGFFSSLPEAARSENPFLLRLGCGEMAKVVHFRFSVRSLQFQLLLKV